MKQATKIKDNHNYWIERNGAKVIAVLAGVTLFIIFGIAEGYYFGRGIV